MDDWHIGIAEEIMSLANAAIYDREPEYSLGGRKDVEMCMAFRGAIAWRVWSHALSIRESTRMKSVTKERVTKERVIFAKISADAVARSCERSEAN